MDFRYKSILKGVIVMPVLHDWYFTCDNNFIQAWGTVEGHQKLPDGMFVHTSGVQSANLNGELLTVETAHTVYTLDCRELNRDYLDDTHKVLKALGVEPKDWNLIISVSLKAFIDKEQEHREYRNKLNAGEIYMVLSTEKPNSVDEVYFGIKENTGTLHVATCHFSVHLGMFTDSVLFNCRHNDEFYDVLRYFPRANNRIEFYSTWNGKQTGVWGYLRNVGKHEIMVELPWGSEIVVQPDTEIQVSFGDGESKENVDWLVLDDLSEALRSE